MTSFFKKIFGKGGKEYTEKSTSQPLPTKLKLENLTDKEIEYVNNNVGLAEELIKDLGLDNQNHVFAPSSLDNAIQAWFDQDLENRFGINVNMFSNALASGWGKFLEEKLDMEWHVITDEFGTEIGLFHKKNNTTIFPFNSTAKAFNNRDFGLLSIITEKASSRTMPKSH
jgi:hypothetical protein